MTKAGFGFQITDAGIDVGKRHGPKYVQERWHGTSTQSILFCRVVI